MSREKAENTWMFVLRDMKTTQLIMIVTRHSNIQHVLSCFCKHLGSTCIERTCYEDAVLATRGRLSDRRLSSVVADAVEALSSIQATVPYIFSQRCSSKPFTPFLSLAAAPCLLAYATPRPRPSPEPCQALMWQVMRMACHGAFGRRALLHWPVQFF